MSWEHIRYRATCDGCGHEGVCIRSSDDWGRSETKFEDFIERAPSAYAVGRRRADANDMLPECPQCAGIAITIDAGPLPTG